MLPSPTAAVHGDGAHGGGRNERTGRTGAGSSLSRAGGTASVCGKTRQEQMEPPLGHVPTLGTPALSASPGRCSGQMPQPSARQDTPGLPTAPGNGSARIHPDDVPETTFLASFYFSTARNRTGTNPVGAGKGTNPLQRMLQYPPTAPAAPPRQPACPSSESRPVGVARPWHRSPGSVLRSVPPEA